MRRRLAKVFEDGRMKPLAKHFAEVTSSEIANDRVLRGSFWTPRRETLDGVDVSKKREAEITDLASFRARRAKREA